MKIRSFKGRKVLNAKPIHGSEIANEMFGKKVYRTLDCIATEGCKVTTEEIRKSNDLPQ